MFAIGNLAIDDDTDVSGHIEDSGMSSFNQKFGEHQFLGSKDNTIFAFHSDNGSASRDKILCIFGSLACVLQLEKSAFLGVSDAVSVEFTHFEIFLKYIQILKISYYKKFKY